MAQRCKDVIARLVKLINKPLELHDNSVNIFAGIEARV
jgi:hypothetical protein